MANPNFDYDKAARILCDAIAIGDKATLDKWDISRPTLHRYRKRLDDDSKLKQAVIEKRDKQDAAWASEIPAALSAGVNFIKKAAQEGRTDSATMVESMTHALEALSDIALTWKVMDERLNAARSETKEV